MANSSPQSGDQSQTMLAMGALFVALVRSLRGLDASIPTRVEAELERLYNEIKHYQADTAAAISLLDHVGKLLREAERTS